MARFRCSQPRRLLLGVLLSVLLACCTPAAETVVPAAEDTPTPAATPTLTAEQLAKIDPELLAAIELEEAEPGKGLQAAAEKYLMDSDGRVRLRVHFDPGKIQVVHDPTEPTGSYFYNPPGGGPSVIVTLTPMPGMPISEQPAGQLILSHNGQILATLESFNEVHCLMFLENVRGLAREDAVTTIIPGSNKNIHRDDPIEATPTP